MQLERPKKMQEKYFNTSFVSKRPQETNLVLKLTKNLKAVYNLPGKKVKFARVALDKNFCTNFLSKARLIFYDTNGNLYQNF